MNAHYNPQVFLCFSGLDRKSIVQSVLYHLQNYGFKIWYDYQQTLLGDDINLTTHKPEVKDSQYAILFFTENFIHSIIGNKELDMLQERYLNGLTHIFPIFFNYDTNELPQKYDWLRKLKYKEVTSKSTCIQTIKQIACKLLLDISKSKNTLNLFDLNILLESEETNSYKYIAKLLKTYRELDQGNLNARIAILYSIYLYIQMNTSLTRDFPSYIATSVERIYKLTNLKISIDQRELRIMELAISILLHAHLKAHLK